VAVVDVMMPEVDGIELARRIKADPALGSAAIIFVSSVGSRRAFGKRLQGLDQCQWLMKPVPRSTLHNALTKALASDAVDAQPAPGHRAGRAINEERIATPLKMPGNRRLKALIAEDNPINQKVARLQLHKLGLDADLVANGREAVEAVLRLPYDVVLMDCQMPERDGYEATKEIRRREGTGAHTRIIAMTAHALEGDKDKCLEAGMDAYVSKPVNVGALARLLAEMLGARASPQD
jgi:CheY-like chemotaxis protein